MRAAFQSVVFGQSTDNSAEAQQFFDRLPTPPPVERQYLYANLINGLVTDQVWPKLDALYITGPSAGLSFINIVQNNFLAQFPATMSYTVDRGFNALSSTVNVIRSGLVPLSGGKFTQDSSFIAAWQNNDDVTDHPNICLMVTASNVSIRIIPKDGGAIKSRVNQAASNSFTNTHANGFFIATRTASNAIETFYNGVSQGTGSNVSVTPENLPLLLLSSCPVDWRCPCWAFGGGLTAANAAALDNRCRTYLTAIGAA